MRAPTVGRNFARADGGFAEQHAAPDREHDAEQQPLRAIGAQHTAELPFEAAALGIAKEGLNGLFTNDKFCWSRPARLHLKWLHRAYRDR